MAAPLPTGDLRFEAVAPASPNLRFGAEGADTGLPPVDAALVGTLPLPVLLAKGLVATPVGLAGTLPGLTLQASLRSPGLADLAVNLPLPSLSALAVARVDASLGGTLPGPTLQAGVSAPINASLTGTLPDLKLAASAHTAKPAIKLVFSRKPATDANLFFAPGDEFVKLTGALPNPSFAASIGQQQQIVRLRFSVEAHDSTRLVFGRDTEAPIKTESATLTGALPAPTLQAQARYRQNTVLVGTLPDPSLQGATQAVARAQLSGVLPDPSLQAFIAAPVEVTLTGEMPAPTFSASLIKTVEVTLTEGLPAPTLLAKTRSIAIARLTGALPLPEVLAEARYLSNTSRPTVGQRATLWRPTSVADQTGLEHRQQVAQKTPSGWQQAWQQGSMLQPGVDHLLPKVLARDHVPGTDLFEQAQPLPDLTAFRHQEAARSVRVLLADAFEQAAQTSDATGFRHQVADRSKRGSVQGEWENARGLNRAWHTDFQPAKPWVLRLGRRYQEAVPPPPGISIFTRPQPPGPAPCYTPDPHLLFSQPFGAMPHLVFMCEGRQRPDFEGTVVVPVRRVYFVINNVSLHRVADGLEVPVYSLSLSLDASSWTWGFEASLPAQAEALVASSSAFEPVKLIARVNGTLFCVYAEHISRERTFVEASIRVSGRGRNAVLGAPYAPVMTFRNGDLRSARQLMDEVLTLNGVPLGWTIDWGLTDWNVPTGVFSLQGTWIEALTTIATSAGAYLLPHPAGQSIRVRHRYPVPPWEWDSVTPDVVLPVDAVSRESLRWLKKPTYNRVFVSGQEVGVLGQVTRGGTAGDILAPMVVDPLITEVAAARQRGLAVLADTGSQIEVSLRLPVLADTGIIEPGAFVEYRDGSVTRLGLVRSTQIEAGLPEVWQTLGVQSHA
jgi:hypothetical protein